MAIQPRGANLNAGLNHKIGGSLRISVGRVRTANHVFKLALAVYRALAPRISIGLEGTKQSRMYTSMITYILFDCCLIDV